MSKLLRRRAGNITGLTVIALLAGSNVAAASAQFKRIAHADVRDVLQRLGIPRPAWRPTPRNPNTTRGYPKQAHRNQSPTEPVDGATLIRQSRTKALMEDDPLACLVDKVAFLEHAPVTGTMGARARSLLGNAERYEAVVTAILCEQRAAREMRTAYAAVLDRGLTRLDFAGAARAAAPILAKVRSVRTATRTIYDYRQDMFGFGSRGFEAASASLQTLFEGEDAIFGSSPDALNDYVFSEKQPRPRAFYAALANHIAAINDVPTLKRLGQDLVPLFNIAMSGNATSFDVTAQDGAGRSDIEGGRDPLKQARSDPGAINIMWLLVAKADGDSQDMMAGKTPRSTILPISPTAQEVAMLFADGFYRGHPDAARLIELKMLTKAQSGQYGAAVTWALPKVAGEDHPVYSDTVTFLVNDRSGPTCVKERAAYDCTFQVYALVSSKDLMADIGNGLYAALTDKKPESDESKQYREDQRVRKRNYPWEQVTATISGTRGAWNSSSIKLVTAELAKRYSAVRDAMARSRNEAANAAFQRQQENLMSEWELRDALKQAEEIRF